VRKRPQRIQQLRQLDDEVLELVHDAGSVGR
jgi:hypothetical protein